MKPALRTILSEIVNHKLCDLIRKFIQNLDLKKMGYHFELKEVYIEEGLYSVSQSSKKFISITLFYLNYRYALIDSGYNLDFARDLSQKIERLFGIHQVDIWLYEYTNEPFKRDKHYDLIYSWKK